MHASWAGFGPPRIEKRLTFRSDVRSRFQVVVQNDHRIPESVPMGFSGWTVESHGTLIDFCGLKGQGASLGNWISYCEFMPYWFFRLDRACKPRIFNKIRTQ